MNYFNSLSINLQNAVNTYKNTLEDLTSSETNISKKQALKILEARDAIQKGLEDFPKIPVDILSELIKLDLTLKENAYKITDVLDLAEYRASLSISDEAWWWNLETTGKPHPLNKLDWLWKTGRSFIWTINLGLLGTLAARFLSGGSGFVEIVAIAFPSAIALLQANDELTNSDEKIFSKWVNFLINKLPDRFKLKSKLLKYLDEEAKLISTFVFSLFLLTIWCLQPEISQHFNRKAFKEHNQEKLAIAEQNYLKAITFDGENLDANYNLGVFYEDLQNFENAKKYYSIAAKGGLPDAYNNLARLYILQKKYPEAFALAMEGLANLNEMSKEEPKAGENLNVLPEVKYSIFKNLGWAMFMQNFDEEAKYYLNYAISIGDDPEYQQYILNPGASHCLLAQVLERNNQVKEALSHWEKCRDLIQDRLASSSKIKINPEEYTWLFMAKDKLK